MRPFLNRSKPGKVGMRCGMTRHQSNKHCNVRALSHKVKCDISVQRIGTNKKQSDCIKARNYTLLRLSVETFFLNICKMLNHCHHYVQVKIRRNTFRSSFRRISLLYPTRTSRKGTQYYERRFTEGQARNQHGTLGEAKSFLRGAQIFETMFTHTLLDFLLKVFFWEIFAKCWKPILFWKNARLKIKELLTAHFPWKN